MLLKVKSMQFATIGILMHKFKFQKPVFNGFHDLLILRPNLRDITIITIESVDYCCINHGVSKSDAIRLLKKYVLDDHGQIQNANERNQY